MVEGGNPAVLKEEKDYNKRGCHLIIRTSAVMFFSLLFLSSLPPLFHPPPAFLFVVLAEAYVCPPATVS